MADRGRIIPRNFMDSVGIGFFPTLGVVRSRVLTRDSTGAEVPGEPTVIAAGRCAIASAKGREVRGDEGRFVEASHVAVFKDKLDLSVEEEMELVADGITYDVVLVDGDSHATYTRMFLLRVI